MTDPMTRLFHLFELDKYLGTAKSICGSELVELAGGIAGMIPFQSVMKEYTKYPLLLYPERMYRVVGNDFVIDVYDEGNGWYQIVKVEISASVNVET